MMVGFLQVLERCRTAMMISDCVLGSAGFPRLMADGVARWKSPDSDGSGRDDERGRRGAAVYTSLLQRHFIATHTLVLTSLTSHTVLEPKLE